MAPTLDTCPKLLALLETFAAPGGEELPREAVLVDRREMPEPYRQLLVHQNDMTSTLARFHGEPMRLNVLGRELADGTLARRVVLVGQQSNRPVEYGASRIRLDALDDDARQKVLQGQVPLGGILNSLGVAYGNCPRGFFTVRSTAAVGRVFGLRRPQWLFGRCNCLSGPLGNTIAEVVEILPPMDTLA